MSPVIVRAFGAMPKRRPGFLEDFQRPPSHEMSFINQGNSNYLSVEVPETAKVYPPRVGGLWNVENYNIALLAKQVLRKVL
jgi:hypothetical protein